MPHTITNNFNFQYVAKKPHKFDALATAHPVL